MNRQEIIQTLTILKAAFPHSYQKMTKADGEAMIVLWERQFANEDPAAVSMAVEALIATRTTGYSPTIGEIKTQIQKLRQANELSDTEAWALVANACRNGIYGYREEFAKLPPEVQRAVGRPEQLRDWAMVDTEELSTVIASNFMRGYKTRQARDKETEMLPQTVQDFISAAASSMRMLPDGQ